MSQIPNTVEMQNALHAASFGCDRASLKKKEKKNGWRFESEWSANKNVKTVCEAAATFVL